MAKITANYVQWSNEHFLWTL